MRRLAWITLVFAACALFGCGDDDTSTSDDNDGGGLGGSNGQHSGSSGHSGSGSGGGDANGMTGNGNGSGGSGTINGAGGAGMAPAPVPCGSTMCQTSALAAGLIDACCADAKTSTCGTSMFGGGCAAPAESDPRCPAIDLMGVFTLASCCAADGQCGIDASQFGMGCTSLAAAGQGGMPMMGLPITLPEPRACDGEQVDAGSDEDAGN